ncbi:MAG: GDSL-type esterase/lipase family protein [Sporomusaceae bacterium]|nr:GDSL-type esterase/lipase family protein [Sporomusaceae bacterium]
MIKRLFITLFAIILCFYILEATNFLGFTHFKPQLEASLEGEQIVLHWTRLPIPVLYKIEVLTSNPTNPHRSENVQTLTSFYSWTNHFTIDPLLKAHTYWRVTAIGLLQHPLGTPSDVISLVKAYDTQEPDTNYYKPVPLKPVENQIVSDTPILMWKAISTAVSYELEILTSPPENPNGSALSAHHLFSTQEVYTNGYQLDVSDRPETTFYWRVRALDYYGNPIGVFSDATELHIDHNKKEVLHPIINNFFNQNGMATPLYPVYSWIPLQRVSGYEVEILSQPDHSNGVAPSPYRLDTKFVTTGNDCYDETPRSKPGIYYWRVRGFDEAGAPVGEYSDCAPFTVDLSKGAYSATLGDSITHGGGAISYSPSDWEYSYQTYFQFPTVNLGKSGDTSESMLARFDADVLPYHPKYLIIMGGSNSLRGGIPASQVISDLAKMRDKCLKNGIRPIFLTLPPINPDNINRAFNEETSPNWKSQFHEVNRFIRSQPYFIDLEPFMTGPDGLLPEYYGLDGLHPDLAGKKLMGQIINLNWSRVTR